MIWSIAWKNIWRNKLRSSIVITAITIGLFAGTFSAALMNGMVMRRVTAAIHQEVSHIQIHHPDFLANKDPEFLIEDAAGLVNELRKMPEVKAVSSRLKAEVGARTARKNAGVEVWSVDPKDERGISELHSMLADSASTFFERKMRYPIFVGKKLADEMNLKVGKSLMLSLQSVNGYSTAGSFKVVGIYKTDNSAFQERTVFVRKKDFAKITGFARSDAHEIAVLLHDKSQAGAVKARIEKAHPNLKTETYLSLAPDLAVMAEYMNVIMLYLIAIILLALGFGIVNTMLMVVLERVKEFGMLMAIGMNKKKVFLMIMLETVYLLFVGGTIGMLGSHFLTLYFGQHGISISQYAEGFEALGYAAVLYPEIGFENYLSISLLILLTGVLASIYPARKAIKLKPAEAIRTV